MYDWEIRKFLEQRNYYIGGDDLTKVIDIRENPQLVRIKYNAYDNSYFMRSNEEEEFFFKAMNYKEAKEKKLAKRR